jgi:integrase
VRFHELRHTCAALLLQGGADLKSVADRLGHASVEMVLKTYGHLVPNMRRESATLMEQFL